MQEEEYKIEDFIDILPNINKLVIYEYYDGYHISYKIEDEKELKDILIPSESCEEYEILLKNISNANNLTQLSYTTRFPREISFRDFKIPINLQTLRVNSVEDLHPENLNGLKELIIEIDGNDTINGKFNTDNINLPYKNYNVLLLDSEDLCKEDIEELENIFGDKLFR